MALHQVMRGRYAQQFVAIIPLFHHQYRSPLGTFGIFQDFLNSFVRTDDVGWLYCHRGFGCFLRRLAWVSRGFD